MEIRKKIIAELTRDDINEAIADWLDKRGWTSDCINFMISCEYGDNHLSARRFHTLDGATINIKQRGSS